MSAILPEGLTPQETVSYVSYKTCDYVVVLTLTICAIKTQNKSMSIRLSTHLPMTASVSVSTAVDRKLVLLSFSASVGMTSKDRQAREKEADHLLSDAEQGQLHQSPLPACPLETPTTISLECIWTEVV